MKFHHIQTLNKSFKYRHFGSLSTIPIVKSPPLKRKNQQKLLKSDHSTSREVFFLARHVFE